MILQPSFVTTTASSILVATAVAFYERGHEVAEHHGFTRG